MNQAQTERADVRPSRRMSAGGTALTAIGAVVVAIFAAMGFMQFVGQRTSPSPLVQGPGAGSPTTDSPGFGGIGRVLARAPQVIADEEIAVSASGAQMRGFTLPDDRPVQVIAEGVRHADKGFMVFLMSSSETDKFAKGEEFRHLASFEGLKVRSFEHSETVAAGSWTVVVQNSENLMNTMVVHLRIVVDPS
jgi:hypothetical protein